jgi:hypothetical protein
MKNPDPDGQAHTTPDAQARAEAQAHNPALITETVAKAEQRCRQGWPWPVSGDDTTVLDPAGTYWGKHDRRRKR